MRKPQKLTSDFYINDSYESIEIFTPVGETTQVRIVRRSNGDYERTGGAAGGVVVLAPGESVALV